MENRNLMREVREKIGYTQEQMAREIKCSLSTVTRCERLSLVPHNEAVKTNFERLAQRAGIKTAAQVEAVTT